MIYDYVLACLLRKSEETNHKKAWIIHETEKSSISGHMAGLEKWVDIWLKVNNNKYKGKGTVLT